MSRNNKGAVVDQDEVVEQEPVMQVASRTTILNFANLGQLSCHMAELGEYPALPTAQEVATAVETANCTEVIRFLSILLLRSAETDSWIGMTSMELQKAGFGFAVIREVRPIVTNCESQLVLMHIIDGIQRFALTPLGADKALKALKLKVRQAA